MQQNEIMTLTFPENEKNLLLISYIFLALGAIPLYGLFFDLCLLIGAFIIKRNYIQSELGYSHIDFI